MSIPNLEQITFRPAQPGDAPGLNRLQMVRYHDATPGDAQYIEQRLDWWSENGIKTYEEWIDDARRHDRHFLHVAAIGKTVVGFARAEASPGSEFTWLRGLFIAKEAEGIGVGGQLERIRQLWAVRSVDPVRHMRGLIVVGNEPSMRFFLRHRYRPVGMQEPTTDLPLHFTVMQLDREQLGAPAAL